MNELLIPTIGPNKLIPHSDPNNIKASENDVLVRPFGCTYYLEDPRAKTKYVSLKVEKAEDFHTTIDGLKYEFYLQKNEDNMLYSILAGYRASSAKSSLKSTFTQVQQLISLWCFKYKRPIQIYRVEIFDRKHKATWLIPNVVPSYSPVIEFPITVLGHTALTSLVSIFKEGINSNILSHKFLSYYKILEAYPNQGPFKEINSYCLVNKLKITRPKFILEEKHLKGCYDDEYHSEYIGKKYSRIKKDLTDIRNAIAHPFTQNRFLDLDAIETQQFLSALTNMLERIVINILENEISTISTLRPIDGSELIDESYNKA